MIKPVLRISAVAGFLYLALAASTYFFQEQLMFHFDPVADDYRYSFETPFENVTIDAPDARLHGVLFHAPGKARGVLVYYKGNMGNVSWSEEIAKPFLRLGFDVLSMDYRGFGKSRGELSEAALLKDAERWYDLAADRYKGRDVRVLGYSMGTTFASHVAAARQVANVILFAPMKSVIDVAERRYPYLPIELLAEYPLRNDLELAQAKGQIVIYHGTDDQIIDYSSGHALTAVLGPDDSFVTIDGGTHYDLPWRQDVRQDIAARWGTQTAVVVDEMPVARMQMAGLASDTAR